MNPKMWNDLKNFAWVDLILPAIARALETGDTSEIERRREWATL